VFVNLSLLPSISCNILKALAFVSHRDKLGIVCRYRFLVEGLGDQNTGILAKEVGRLQPGVHIGVLLVSRK
jgi:hypothetical protein